MEDLRCKMFSNATSGVTCNKRYVNFSIPDRVLNWAARDYFGVSVDELMKSPTFRSVLEAHVGVKYNNGEVTIYNIKYDANLKNNVDTVDIISGPKFNTGVETYIINGIVLTENQLNNIIEELGTTTDALKWLAKVANLFKSGMGRTKKKCATTEKLIEEYEVLMGKREGKPATGTMLKAKQRLDRMKVK